MVDHRFGIPQAEVGPHWGQITVFDPARRLEIEGEIGPFQARIGYALEPLGDATRLTNDVELEPSSAVSRLTAPLAASRVKAAVASNLDELKLILERGRRRWGEDSEAQSRS